MPGTESDLPLTPPSLHPTQVEVDEEFIKNQSAALLESATATATAQSLSLVTIISLEVT